MDPDGLEYSRQLAHMDQMMAASKSRLRAAVEWARKNPDKSPAQRVAKLLVTLNKTGNFPTEACALLAVAVEMLAYPEES